MCFYDHTPYPLRQTHPEGMEAMGHPQCSASGAIVGGLGPCARVMVTRMMPATLWLASLTTRLPVAGYSVHLTTAYSDDASARNVCKL